MKNDFDEQVTRALALIEEGTDPHEVGDDNPLEDPKLEALATLVRGDGPMREARAAILTAYRIGVSHMARKAGVKEAFE